MDYISQYYKNRAIHLQDELEQLTETYEYRLNEASWLSRLFGAEDVPVTTTPTRRTPIAAGAAPSAPPMTPAQVAAERARQQAAAALAARIFARDVRLAMQTVVNHLMDIPAGNWGAFAGTLSPAERAAYNRLFTHAAHPEFNGIRTGIIPGHGPCPQRVLFYEGRYRVMWWNEANERWYFAGKGVQTEFGNTGTTGYITPPGAKSNLQSTNMVDTIDPDLQNTQLASTRPGIGSNGSGLGSNGSGLGSVAALYMSYDPRAVSRKINYITENYYRN